MTDAALLQEFQSEAEVAKNDAVGALGTSGGLSTEAKMGVVPKAQRASYRRAVALCQRALKISDAGDHAEAARHALKALDLVPDSALPNHMIGLLLYRVGRLYKALECYERAWQIDPQDPLLYLNMGLVAWKLDMLDAAEKFYRLCIELSPNNVHGIINLASVLRDQGRFDAAIEILRSHIYHKPENTELWNSLGTVVADSGDPVGAIPFYEEALRLDPNFARPHNNLGNVFELTGEAERALEHYNIALDLPMDATDQATIRHGRSNALLAAGHLAEGWEAAESRLDPLRPEATLFSIETERWDGADAEQIRGKTVIMVGEQGLGDEVLFMNTVNDMIEAVGPDGELRVCVEHRLQSLVERSFPKAKVFHHLSTVLEGRDVRVVKDIDQDADYWTPMATPLRAFRKTHDDFPKQAGFLKPDPDQVDAFREQLAGLGKGPKIGLLWKSLKMTPRRSRFFSAFDAWEPVLTKSGAHFVNLQYGQVEEELALAKTRYGVDVHQPEGLDLKMDLDKVAALSSSCDLVIAPMNATSNLAAASGGLVWFIHARKSTWTLLGTEHHLWYPQTRAFFGDGFQDWENTMKRVAAELDGFIADFG